ncbi:hypothetical protein [Providencia stuartii]|uniref:hypothetical protein n=1 Tax=Providencia stuartii TaxID=588 RepID=UPI003D7F6105
MKDKKILTMNGLVNKKDLAPKVTYIDNLKVRKYKKRGEYYAQRALAKGRSVEEIWDSIFGVERKNALFSLSNQQSIIQVETTVAYLM